MKSYTFAIHTLGCKVNTYESDMMAGAMTSAGFFECDFSESADIYIINTCTVTNIADRKSRQLLRRARTKNPDALIVAAGCYVDDAKKDGRLTGLIEERVIDLAVPNSKKGSIAELISDRLGLSAETEPSPDGVSAALTESCRAGGTSERHSFLTGLDGHTRAFIKVQDGCNMFCSYCVIPYVRGNISIRPNEDTLREIRLLAAGGVSEVVITGIHLSSMGSRLLDLIKQIDGIDGIRRVRLGSLEPMFITERTVDVLRSCEKLCPHFHLSLQSGSDTILRSMNRHYSTERYEKSCEMLRKVFEHPAITTDIIVGFPGETEEYFSETVDFVRRIGFYEAHVFKYSRRKGTAADAMDCQLTEAIKQERSSRLIAVCRELSESFREYYYGRETSFISEELCEHEGETFETGYTPEYVRAVKKTRTLHQNELIKGVCSQILQSKDIDGRLLLE